MNDYSSAASASNSGSPLANLIPPVLLVVIIASLWRVFTKAGQPGWGALIPFYNMYILLKIVGRPGWWMALLFIPFVNFVITLIVSIDLAKAFGRSSTFGVLGLFLFSFIGYPMLGFGKDQYVGPAVAGAPVLAV